MGWNFLIPLAAQAVGTALGYTQRGTNLPRIDNSAALKAAKLASQIPSASTVMQRGRQDLGAQVGSMRSMITRMGRDTNINPEALRTISERMVAPLSSTYIQGMGRVYGQAIESGRARAMAAANAAQISQQGQYQNAQITAQEESMRPNPLEMGAAFGGIAGQMMNIKSMDDYIGMLSGLFGGDQQWNYNLNPPTMTPYSTPTG